jgi:hypothetical protein
LKDLNNLAVGFYRLRPRRPERTAAKHNGHAQKLRHRAEECRTLARLTDTEENAARHFRMADAYDALAEQEQQLARDVVRFNLERKRSHLSRND